MVFSAEILSVTSTVTTFSPTAHVTLPVTTSSPNLTTTVSYLSSGVAVIVDLAVVAVPVYMYVSVANVGLNVTPLMLSPFNALRLTEGLQHPPGRTYHQIHYRC